MWLPDVFPFGGEMVGFTTRPQNDDKTHKNKINVVDCRHRDATWWMVKHKAECATIAAVYRLNHAYAESVMASCYLSVPLVFAGVGYSTRCYRGCVRQGVMTSVVPKLDDNTAYVRAHECCEPVLCHENTIKEYQAEMEVSNPFAILHDYSVDGYTHVKCRASTFGSNEFWFKSPDIFRGIFEKNDFAIMPYAYPKTIDGTNLRQTRPVTYKFHAGPESIYSTGVFTGHTFTYEDEYTNSINGTKVRCPDTTKFSVLMADYVASEKSIHAFREMCHLTPKKDAGYPHNYTSFYETTKTRPLSDREYWEDSNDLCAKTAPEFNNHEYLFRETYVRKPFDLVYTNSRNATPQNDYTIGDKMSMADKRHVYAANNQKEHPNAYRDFVHTINAGFVADAVKEFNYNVDRTRYSHVIEQSHQIVSEPQVEKAAVVEFQKNAQRRMTARANFDDEMRFVDDELHAATVGISDATNHLVADVMASMHEHAMFELNFIAKDLAKEEVMTGGVALASKLAPIVAEKIGKILPSTGAYLTDLYNSVSSGVLERAADGEVKSARDLLSAVRDSYDDVRATEDIAYDVGENVGQDVVGAVQSRLAKPIGNAVVHVAEEEMPKAVEFTAKAASEAATISTVAADVGLFSMSAALVEAAPVLLILGACELAEYLVKKNATKRQEAYARRQDREAFAEYYSTLVPMRTDLPDLILDRIYRAVCERDPTNNALLENLGYSHWKPTQASPHARFHHDPNVVFRVYGPHNPADPNAPVNLSQRIYTTNNGFVHPWSTYTGTYNTYKKPAIQYGTLAELISVNMLTLHMVDPAWRTIHADTLTNTNHLSILRELEVRELIRSMKCLDKYLRAPMWSDAESKFTDFCFPLTYVANKPKTLDKQHMTPIPVSTPRSSGHFGDADVQCLRFLAGGDTITAFQKQFQDAWTSHVDTVTQTYGACPQMTVNLVEGALVVRVPVPVFAPEVSPTMFVSSEDPTFFWPTVGSARSGVKAGLIGVPTSIGTSPEDKKFAEVKTLLETCASATKGDACYSYILILVQLLKRYKTREDVLDVIADGVTIMHDGRDAVVFPTDPRQGFNIIQKISELVTRTNDTQPPLFVACDEPKPIPLTPEGYDFPVQIHAGDMRQPETTLEIMCRKFEPETARCRALVVTLQNANVYDGIFDIINNHENGLIKHAQADDTETKVAMGAAEEIRHLRCAVADKSRGAHDVAYVESIAAYLSRTEMTTLSGLVANAVLRMLRAVSVIFARRKASRALTSVEKACIVACEMAYRRSLHPKSFAMNNENGKPLNWHLLPTSSEHVLVFHDDISMNLIFVFQGTRRLSVALESKNTDAMTRFLSATDIASREACKFADYLLDILVVLGDTSGKFASSMGISSRFPDAVSVVRAHLDTYGVRKIILAGHSLGGAIATHVLETISSTVDAEAIVFNPAQGYSESYLTDVLNETARPFHANLTTHVSAAPSILGADPVSILAGGVGTVVATDTRARGFHAHALSNFNMDARVDYIDDAPIVPPKRDNKRKTDDFEVGCADGEVLVGNKCKKI